MGNDLCRCARRPSTSLKRSSSPSHSVLIDSFSLPTGVSICWVDARADNDSRETQSMRDTLHRLHASVFFWTNVPTCLSSLQSNRNQHARVFLIVSGAWSEAILSELHTNPCIDSVFIYCTRRRRYTDLIARFRPQLIDVFTDLPTLESAVKDELSTLDQRQFSASFFAQKQSATRDLTHDAASFLWFQLLQSVFLQGRYDDNDKKLMLDHCRHFYARAAKRNTFYSQINEFNKNYSSKNAIRWYTKDIFLYKLVNTALRTEDVEALCLFRFFLADLSRQLIVEHKRLTCTATDTPIVTLYRGCTMSDEDVQKFRELNNEMTSFNGFLSTTSERRVAEKFLHRPSRLIDPQKVLFIIRADRRLDGLVFAPIDHLTDYPDEHEVLFNLDSAFFIDEVHFESTTRVHHIRMRATGQGGKVTANYIDLVHNELMNSSAQIIFGQLLLDMGKPIAAHKYFLNLLQRFGHTDHVDLGDIHYHLALTFAAQKEVERAEEHLLNAVDRHSRLTEKRRNVVRTKNALGWIHQDNGDLSTAMHFYRQAEQIGKELLGEDHLGNAQTWTNIGSCQLERSQFLDARSSFQRALHILKKHLPADHPRVAVVLTDLGNIARKETDTARSTALSNALSFYEEAERIFRAQLPLHHPHTAYCWSCMGFLFLREKNFVEARRAHERALRSYQRTLPADHINIHISEQNIKCRAYERINDNYLRFYS